MKVAVPAEGPDLDAKVGDRLGLSSHLLVIDLESKRFEAHRSPRTSGSGVGMEMVALIISKKCNFLLTKWCSPTAEKYLSAYGVGIVTGISGTVDEALEKFERGNPKAQAEKHIPPLIAFRINRRVAVQAIASASRQLSGLLPVMVGVVFLVGLFSAFISEEVISSFFSGTLWQDSFRGALSGSAFAGNPINSYIIGGKLLKLGVSPVGVSAFMCAWVTVGFVQLPAEIAALGWRFAVLRNLSCFGLSIALSFGMMLILNVLGM